MKLRIGIDNNLFTDRVQDLVKSGGIDFELIMLKETREMINQLKTGAIQAIVIPLEGAPFFDQTEMIIAALSERLAANNCLLINKDSFDPSQVLRLKKGVTVHSITALEKAMLSEIRPDLVHCELSALRVGDHIDALFTSEEYVEKFFDGDLFEKMTLSPFEFPPVPGTGVLSFVCLRADTDTRRHLQKIHHKEVSVCTNVERAVMREQIENRKNMGVWCERDANGYYHACAVCLKDGRIRRGRASSSTHAGLAQELARQIF
jgi:porphobilinogen deaminase